MKLFKIMHKSVTLQFHNIFYYFLAVFIVSFLGDSTWARPDSARIKKAKQQFVKKEEELKGQEKAALDALYKRKGKWGLKCKKAARKKCWDDNPLEYGEGTWRDWTGSVTWRNRKVRGKRDLCWSEGIQACNNEIHNKMREWSEYKKVENLKKRHKLLRKEFNEFIDGHLRAMERSARGVEISKEFKKDMESGKNLSDKAKFIKWCKEVNGEFTEKKELEEKLKKMGEKVTDVQDTCYCKKFNITVTKRTDYNRSMCIDGPFATYKKYYKQLICGDRGLKTISDQKKKDLQDILKIVSPKACSAAVPPEDIAALTKDISSLYNKYLEGQINERMANREAQKLANKIGGVRGPQRNAMLNSITKSIMGRVLHAKMKDEFLEAFHKINNSKDPSEKQKIENALGKKIYGLLEKNNIKHQKGEIFQKYFDKYKKSYQGFVKNGASYNPKTKSWDLSKIESKLSPQALVKNKDLAEAIALTHSPQKVNQLLDPNRTTVVKLGNSTLSPPLGYDKLPMKPYLMTTKSADATLKKALSDFSKAQAELTSIYSKHFKGLNVVQSWKYLICQVRRKFGSKCNEDPAPLSGYGSGLDVYIPRIESLQKSIIHNLAVARRYGGPQIERAMRSIDLKTAKMNSRKMDEFIDYITKVQWGVGTAPLIPIAMAAAGPLALKLGFKAALGVKAVVGAAALPMAWSVGSGLLDAAFEDTTDDSGPFWCRALNRVGDAVYGGLAYSSAASLIPVAIMGAAVYLPALGAKIGIIKTAAGYKLAAAKIYGAGNWIVGKAFFGMAIKAGIQGAQQCFRDIKNIESNLSDKGSEGEVRKYLKGRSIRKMLSTCSKEMLKAALLFKQGKQHTKEFKRTWAKLRGKTPGPSSGATAHTSHGHGKTGGGVDAKVPRWAMRKFKQQAAGLSRAEMRVNNLQLKATYHRMKAGQIKRQLKNSNLSRRDRAKLTKSYNKHAKGFNKHAKALRKLQRTTSNQPHMRSKFKLLGKEARRVRARPKFHSKKAQQEVDYIKRKLKEAGVSLRGKKGGEKNVASGKGEVNGEKYEVYAVSGTEDVGKVGKMRFAKSNPSNKKGFTAHYTKDGKVLSPTDPRVLKAERLRLQKEKWDPFQTNQKARDAYVRQLVKEGTLSKEQAIEMGFLKKNGKLNPKGIGKYIRKVSKAYSDHVTKNKMQSRRTDTEVKVLEDFDQRYGANPTKVKGRIVLTSNLDFCPSCWQVIQQFRMKYPKVQLDIRYAQPTGGGGGHQH